MHLGSWKKHSFANELIRLTIDKVVEKMLLERAIQIMNFNIIVCKDGRNFFLLYWEEVERLFFLISFTLLSKLDIFANNHQLFHRIKQSITLSHITIVNKDTLLSLITKFFFKLFRYMRIPLVECWCSVADQIVVNKYYHYRRYSVSTFNIVVIQHI